MSGRPIVPIPDDRPAKLLAEKLRLLKGTDISYRAMGKVARGEHNTFSTTANGSYKGWPSVAQFLDALTKCGRVVTEEDVRECKALHQVAQRNAQSEKDTARPPAPADVGEEQRVALPVDNKASIDMPVVSIEYAIHTTAVPPSLADAQHPRDLVASLVDLVMEKRLDLDAWRTRDTDSREAQRRGSAEWEVLTGRRAPTWAVVRRIVAQAGGGTPDLARWELAWRRVNGGEIGAIGVAKVAEPSGIDEVPAGAPQTDSGEPHEAWWHRRWFRTKRGTPGDGRQPAAAARRRRGAHRAPSAH